MSVSYPPVFFIPRSMVKAVTTTATAPSVMVTATVTVMATATTIN